MTIKTSKRPCGFCSTDTHQYCPGVVGEGDHMYRCPCGCDKATARYCKVCGNDYADEVREETWTCEDAGQCMSRVDRKREELRHRLMPNGTPAKKTSGKACNCNCGEETGGGLFKPGHADKLAKATAEQVKAGTLNYEDAVEQLTAISDGLLKKLDARL